jgi:hypothetical protein
MRVFPERLRSYHPEESTYCTPKSTAPFLHGGLLWETPSIHRLRVSYPVCYSNARQLRLCVALVHFLRGQGFSATADAALIFSVPLAHFAWTARPS